MDSARKLAFDLGRTAFCILLVEICRGVLFPPDATYHRASINNNIQSVMFGFIALPRSTDFEPFDLVVYPYLQF